uniref:Putative secreted protein n=1 Tax=Panstrongylus lignarius TaxID=156445 RepID=A0A224Y4B1_9HEMI
MKLTLLCFFIGMFAVAYCASTQDYLEPDDEIAEQYETMRYRRDLIPVCIKPLFSYQRVDHGSCIRHCLLKGQTGQCEDTKCVCRPTG